MVPMLDDVLDTGLRLVICGSAASATSARVGAYYAGPQNRFWLTLFEVGLTPRQLAPGEFRELLQFGIGLTDIVKTQAGNDRDLRPAPSDGDDLRRRMLRYAPRLLCFNGKRAAQQFLDTKSVAFGLQATTLGSTRIFVAPSTSAAARGHWDPGVWYEMAKLALAGSAAPPDQR